MALIKDSYDLTGGTAYSDEVTSLTNWRIQVKLENCNTGQRTRITVETKGEDITDYEPIRDEDDHIISQIYETNDGGIINLALVNAPTGRVKIEPLTDTDITIAGTVSIDSYQS